MKAVWSRDDDRIDVGLAKQGERIAPCRADAAGARGCCERRGIGIAEGGHDGIAAQRDAWQVIGDGDVSGSNEGDTNRHGPNSMSEVPLEQMVHFLACRHRGLSAGSRDRDRRRR
jgi:hypothetical protein